jgi:hypothetical protein
MPLCRCRSPILNPPAPVQYPCRARQPGEPGNDAPFCSSAEQAGGTLTQGIPGTSPASTHPVGREISGVARGRQTHLAVALVTVLAAALLGLSTRPALASPGPCVDADATAPGPTLEAVAPGVWRVPAARGDADAANRGATTQMVLVQDGSRRWLVGSGPSPAYGAALACAVQRVSGGGVTDVVNTRAAPELAMGNVAFAPARLWALPEVIAAMRARCPQCQERLKSRLGADVGASLQPESIRAPSRAVGAAGARAGRLGPFEWLALERAAGERTLVLRLRRSRLVVAQGLVWAGDVPDLRDTESAALAASLRRLRGFTAGRRLLGEQGPAAGTEAVDAHLLYLGALRAAIEPLLLRGELPGSPAAAIELAAFAALPGYAAWHPLNVQHVWRELETALFR